MRRPVYDSLQREYTIYLCLSCDQSISCLSCPKCSFSDLTLDAAYMRSNENVMVPWYMVHQMVSNCIITYCRIDASVRTDVFGRPGYQYLDGNIFPCNDCRPFSHSELTDAEIIMETLLVLVGNRFPSGSWSPTLSLLLHAMFMARIYV